MNRPLRIAHLFPELLNLYADQGNIAVLCGRAALRAIEVEVVPIRLGDPLDLAELDLLLLGGGSDREQAVVARGLPFYAADLRQAVEADLPILAVCGGYQLLGNYYELASGERMQGLGLVDMVTRSGGKRERLIGNIAITWQAPYDGVRETIVGFENHGGRTYHDYLPFGQVLRGHGNNGEDGLEGIRYRGLIGTYMHGPLLPKNPHLADDLLTRARAYRGTHEPLAPLPDELEWIAHDQALQSLLPSYRGASAARVSGKA